jgi:murein L,D-transpeptidase YafK
MRLLILALLLNLSAYSQTNENRFIFIRVFKYEKQVEVWTSDFEKGEYTLYKKYPICKISGILGPKRREGDYQVPEGFYYINRFNPYSQYKRSMGINYPNKSDSILSTHKKLGGSIYIHGDCISVGCIAIGNKFVEELFSQCVKNKNKIQVHIFPVRFDNQRVNNILRLENKTNEVKEFNCNLESGYRYFEKHRYPPQITISDTGEYIFL